VRYRVVRTHGEPTEAELHEFRGGHLCGCSGYVPILAATLDAAKKLRETRAYA
jgi:2-furoyl-CoA dehydrogenase 2Fe-2S iron sulfur subunit